MALDDYRPVFNTSLKLRRPLGFSEEQVASFFSAVSQAVPQLTEYRQTEKDFHLLELQTGQVVRQVMFRQDELALAVAPPMTLLEADSTARALYPLIGEHVKPTPFLIKHLDVSLRFEFPYKGNHDLLVLRELFGQSPFAEIAAGVEGTVRDFQPTLNVSLTADHSIVALIGIHTSTSEREIESGVFDGDKIGIVCGVGKVRNLAEQDLVATYISLFSQAVTFVEARLLNSLVDRLRRACEGAAQ